MTIFYTTPIVTTFVKKDLKIFEKEHDVLFHHFNPSPKWQTPFQFLKHFFKIIFNLSKIDVFVCQFAGYAAFFPVLFSKLTGKPSLIIAAGTESAGLKSINYGDFIHPIVKHFTKFALKNTSHITPVHRSLMGFKYSYFDEKFGRQGADGFIDNFKTPFTEAFYGFNEKKFVNLGIERTPKSFMTIASGFEQEVVYYRKGLDLLFGVAARNPDWKFTVVGKRGELKKNHPENVEIISSVPQEELIKMLNQHQFYCQVSRFEGFPNALGEAMLCGCVPIGSNVTAMPEMISNTGFILEKHSVDNFEKLLKKVITDTSIKTKSKNARQRVIDNYPTKLREKTLLDILKKLQ